jgi:signal transduction histidine kinase
LIAPLKNGTSEVLNYIAVKEDITEKKLITAELKQRDKILQAASNAAENFLKNPNWETNIINILEVIGTAAEVDRAYLFENYLDEKGNLQCRQKFEWTADGIEPKLANPVIHNLCYRPVGFLRWKEMLEKNEIVQGDTKDFPQKEKELLAIQSVLSILIQPIFIENHWWGFIGFDNCRKEKTWSAGLINALKVVADTFGSALYKNKVEQKLREEKEKAEEASKLKSNLMANMSHEIRTPMVGILGFTELLMEEIKDAHTKTIIETISTSAKRLMSTLESVLELSSLESSKIESHLEKTDIVPVLKTLTEGYKKIANNRSLELELFIKDKELISETDPDMLHKALSKLVDNAIKYTEYGNIVIKAESVISDNIRSIEINVADSGIGIPENYKHLVFEPFRQASEGYARKYEGIGLGLTLAKKYIELLGGSLSLDSSGNTGSRFIITIPVSSS